MAQVDFSKLKKLPPEMRIKALNKLEEELNNLIKSRQQEIEEAQALLNEAKHELQVIEEIETPKIKEIQVEQLFNKKEDASIEKKAELERIAEEAPRTQAPEQVDYARFIAKELSPEQIHNKLYDIRKEQTSTGIETWYQRNFVNAAAQALELKREFGDYTSGSKKEATLTASERLVNYLKG